VPWKIRLSLGTRTCSKTVVIGLLSWFVLDSAGSALSNNQPNIFFNIVVLLTAVGPLWRAGSAERGEA
jgi:hypothetical protein